MDKKIKIMVEIALAVSLATVLNFIPLWKMPQGGSVSLEMLPIFIIALRRGLKPGMLAGLIYGLLQLAFNPYIIHPVQLLMDYPLPYMFIGLSGILEKKISKSSKGKIKWLLTAFLLGGFTRLVIHTLSGVVFFSQYAPEGQNVWIYSLVYNGSYLLPALIISFLVFLSLSRIILEYNK